VDTAMQADSIVKSQTVALGNTVQVFDSINDHVKELANNLNNISNGIKRIEIAKTDTLDAIQDISAVSQETAAASEEVSATAMNQIDAVEHMAIAVSELSDNAKSLEEAIKVFKIS
jgi:methyl-accepting chemotaxis protein